MGVSSILPTENDRVCTVSPHGVRVRARGRVLISDKEGMDSRNTVVAGCTNRTIRLLDGERRMVEVAKAKAQRGGVAKVAVHDNLIMCHGLFIHGRSVSVGASALSIPITTRVYL
eukprot:scaffold16052_cov42-Cyclotella_meneghiniana.AAC.3